MTGMTGHGSGMTGMTGNGQGMAGNAREMKDWLWDVKGHDFRS